MMPIQRVPMKSQRRLLTGPVNTSQALGNSKSTRHTLENFPDGFQKDEKTFNRSCKPESELQNHTKIFRRLSKGCLVLEWTKIEIVASTDRKCEGQVNPTGAIDSQSEENKEYRAAFASHKPIKISSPSGEIIKLYYKISIPLRKIKKATESKSLKKPSDKYIQVVTEDSFDFWFMGFLNHKSILKCLQEAIYETQCHYSMTKLGILCIQTGVDSEFDTFGITSDGQACTLIFCC
ncbi:hypothetical protein K7X08_029837 [Anisodus acutangulus]|uniref:GRAM domain-containing protein n=1 Tax=Anisodus acutangulus TaxID=402998 RepID=A0A9Q1M2L8_9SOLA|nr:hypothetical protein K7X08_029837 [Anisodus acutangulus]